MDLSGLLVLSPVGVDTFTAGALAAEHPCGRTSRMMSQVVVVGLLTEAADHHQGRPSGPLTC